jgi:hypothetical protein
MAGYLVDSPNYEEIKYTSDNELYDKAQEAIEKERLKKRLKNQKE